MEKNICAGRFVLRPTPAALFEMPGYIYSRCGERISRCLKLGEK